MVALFETPDGRDQCGRHCVSLLVAGVQRICRAVLNPEDSFIKYKLTSPSPVHLFDAQGNFHRPFVYKIVRTRNPKTLRSIYAEDKSTLYPIRFFVQGSEYKMWGLWPTQLHLFGLDVPQSEQGIFLWGADRLGRDVFTDKLWHAHFIDHWPRQRHRQPGFGHFAGRVVRFLRRHGG